LATDNTEAIQQVPSPPAAKAETGRVRLGFLDGIRGWAALYVVIFHIGVSHALVAQHPLLLSWTRHGHYAVSVFIVLSGYCLMLPVVRTVDGSLPGGFGTYIRRRARRLLPPYYAAFVLSLLVVLMSMLLHYSDDKPIDRDLLQFQPGNLITHLLVIHNLSKEYYQYTNPALWSVGTEWQIYFLFPALLLPVWRRYGVVASVIVGTLAGIAPMLLLPSAYNLKWASLWYLGTFAMGMAAAVVSFSPKPAMQAANRWRGWKTVLALSLAASYFKVRFGEQSVGWDVPESAWITDLIMGIATAAGIIILANSSGSPQQGIVWKFLQSPLSERLGQFSYSLYLVHMPIGYMLGPVSSKFQNHPWIAQAFCTFILLPTVLVGAWIFYMLVERHFINSPATAAKPSKASVPAAQTLPTA
jgi:peptidoglycan/LPS O-acetylase OafA/YrhL